MLKNQAFEIKRSVDISVRTKRLKDQIKRQETALFARGWTRLLQVAISLAIFLCGPSGTAKAQALTEGEFAEVLSLLQTHFTEQASLKDKSLTATTLTDLLPSLGVSLATDSFRHANTDPIKTEILPTQITYWRLGTYQPPKGIELEALLEPSLAGKSKGLILDLRDTQAPNDFEGAASVVNDLAQISTVLFSLQGLQTPQQVFQITQQTMFYNHPIIVLINRDTTGSGEALAAAMRRSAKAILVGRSTLGLGAFFVESKLKSGRYIRIPTAMVTLPDGTKLCGQPLQPDIPIFVNDEQEREAMAQIRLGPASQGLIQKNHKLLNEMALVKGENPELDDVFTKNEKKKEVKTVQDLVLMRAVDILNAINAIYPSALQGEEGGWKN